jgi:hypothetical protein
VDILNYRNNISVELGERLNWLVKWPKGTHVNMVESFATPQWAWKFFFLTVLKEFMALHCNHTWERLNDEIDARLSER